eukprot:12570767-Ditylum_brightwellii.AAC.2
MRMMMMMMMMKNNANTSKKKETASTKPIQLFTEQSDGTIASATSFTFEYLQQKQIKSIEWQIMGDTEFLMDNNKIDLIHNNKVKMLEEIDWSNTNEAFFDAVFPSILDHDKIIDDFLSDPRAEYHQT